MRKFAFSTLFLCSIASSATATAALAPGAPDPTYGTGGKQLVAETLTSKGLQRVLVDAQGRAYVVATVLLDTQAQGIGIDRRNPDGSIDASFAPVRFLPDAVAALAVRDAALQPDGKLVVVGQAPTDLGSAFVACRFNADGTSDSQFGEAIGDVPATPGCSIVAVASPASTGRANAVAVQADGRIVMAGFMTLGGKSTGAIVALDQHGSLQTDFGVGGLLFTPASVTTSATTFEDVSLGAGDAIVVAGSRVVSASDSDFLVARFNKDGDAITSFNVDGYRTIAFDHGANLGNVDTASAARMLADGSVLVAGTVQTPTFGDEGAEFNPAVVKLTPAGATDDAFVGDPNSVDDRVQFICQSPLDRCVARANDMDVLADGSIVVVGSIADTPTIATPKQQIDAANFFVLRLAADGSRDATFGSGDTNEAGMALVKFDQNAGSGEDVALDVVVQGETLLVAGYANVPGEDSDQFDVAIVRLGNRAVLFSDGFE